MHMDMLQEPFCVEIYRKNAVHKSRVVWKLIGKLPASPSGNHVLDGILGTCYKSHFVWKFTGRVPDPNSGAPVWCGNLKEKTHMDMSQELFCVEIYRKNAAHVFRGPHFVWKFRG